MSALIGLTLGSIAGGFARYFLAGGMYRAVGTGFPYGTLAVNVSGCFLIGLFDSLAQGKLPLTHEARILLMTGFCGAFTTFSAFILETSNLIKAGEGARAAGNIAASLVLGFLFFKLGDLLGRV